MTTEAVRAPGAKRLAWHEEKSGGRTKFIRAANEAKMQAWRETDWEKLIAGMPGSAHALNAEALDLQRRGRENMNKWDHAERGEWYDSRARSGMYHQAQGQLRRSEEKFEILDALLSGEIPEAWAYCQHVVGEVEEGEQAQVCGAPYKPGPRGYKMCWQCSNRERVYGQVRCVFCSKLHPVKFATCWECRPIEGRNEAASLMRSVVMRRDAFTCQLCGDDEADVLQVDHIMPCALGGKAEWWNLETLCVDCNLLKAAQYGPLDEMEQWYLMEAYNTYLYDFLSAEEKDRLRADMVEIGGGWFSTVEWTSKVDPAEREGYLNLLEGMKVYEVPPPPVPSAVVRTLPPSRLPEPPEGRWPSSAGAMLKLAQACGWEARVTYALGSWREKSVESVLVQAVKGSRIFEACWIAWMGGKYKFESALSNGPTKLSSAEAKAYLQRW